MFEGPGNDPALGGGVRNALTSTIHYCTPIVIKHSTHLHGEALATAGLAVSEDCAVVPLQHPLHQRKPVVVVDRLRGRIRPVNTVECKTLWGRR